MRIVSTKSLDKENIPINTPPPLLKQPHEQSSTLRPFNSTPQSGIVEQDQDVSSCATIPMPPSPLSNPRKYYDSSVSTLVKSLSPQAEVSYTDLNEAYTELANRIRTDADAINDETQAHPSLAVIRKASSSIVQAMRRDIKLILTEPSLEALTGLKTPTNEQALTALEAYYSLTNNTLRLLSDIFSMRPLYKQFTAGELRSLLGEITPVYLAQKLPSPNPQRVRDFILWILSSQTLPPDVLSPYAPTVAILARQALSSGTEKSQNRTNSLKIILKLVTNYKAEIAPSLLPFFSNLLLFLLAPNFEYRLLVTRIISRLAAAKLENGSAFVEDFQSIAAKIRDFIAEYSSLTAKQSELGDIRTALSPKRAVETQNPGWSLVAISSLIVLSDYGALTHRPSIVLFVKTLSEAPSQQRLKRLQPIVWKCLVWAFSSVLEMRTMSDTPRAEETVEKAFLVVQEELKGGIGEAIMAAVLNAEDGSTEGVSRALSVLEKMVSSDHVPTRADGIFLLSQVLGSIGTSSLPGKDIPAVKSYLPLELLDGTILNATSKTISSVVEAMNKQSPHLLWQLSEEDIIRKWDVLIDIWITASTAVLRDPDTALLKNLIGTWQSLLLVQTQLTQGGVHLTTSSGFTGQVLSTMSGFLPTSGPNGSVEALTRSLRFVSSLWSVAKNVFSDPWLHGLAEDLLKKILAIQCPADTPDLHSAWANLCEDLAASLDVSRCNEFGILGDIMSSEPGVTMRLWRVLARKWKDVDLLSEHVLVTLLKVSFGKWPTTNNDLEIWRELLSKTTSKAAVSSSKLVSDILEDNYSKSYIDPKQFLTLFITAGTIDLSNRVLQVADENLSALYPPPADALPLCLQTLRFLGQMIPSSSSILNIVTSFQQSLQLWIADESNILSSADHEELIRQLYCRPLDMLHKHELSISVLDKLSAFLACGFCHDHSGLGPAAFTRFWCATYRDVKEFYGRYPPPIVKCLSVLNDINSQLVGDGLPESQFTPCSIVPDSDPHSGHSIPLDSSRRGRASNSTPRLVYLEEYPEPAGSSNVSSSPAAPLPFLPPQSSPVGTEAPATPSPEPREFLPSLKRSSPSNSDGDNQAKKRKILAGAGAFPYSPPGASRKQVFEGVVIPRYTASTAHRSRESQLMTPGPSSQDSFSMDLDEEAPIVNDAYEEHAEAGTVSFLSMPKALSEMSVVVGEFSDDHGHEDIAGRHLTEPLPASSAEDRPPLRRNQTTPANSSTPAALDALRRACTAFSGDAPMQREALMEAQHLVHTLSRKDT
ncbi:uncharacterized protein EV420DRAFT_1744857 [Desarmillaria tabescens]|uniref:Telomere-associated protein Rif1 N-terminal domain-containing protein n=1 Tax=Armillaria tabescens TaxID=1929756 RepID=A0AA39NF53_ARMTA|nr:uncharacterized protein EV420DRAFT_1744857 [Desarmillaria tabescens]KAK0464493.1 hypothetical protein EV420DRAFT_1744857 [Desarmillaria tabescens]